MKKNILITGGTGLVGSRLKKILIQKGYTVSLLSRKGGEEHDGKFRWDIKNNFIDERAIANADYVIHLAGAGVFEKRWTNEYKKEILSSRVDSTKLLAEKIKTIPNKIKGFISASAIGIYGADTGIRLLTEESVVGDGYLAYVTDQWEKSSHAIELYGIRTVRLRIGIVFAKEGGALKEFSGLIQNFVGSPMGKGTQYMSWIHIDDLCEMFIYAIENEALSGTYNAVAPEPATNATIVKEIGKTLKRSIWLPNVPSFAMNLMLGKEQAAILLGGNNVSAQKIISSGFKFDFPNLSLALQQLLQNDK